MTEVGDETLMRGRRFVLIKQGDVQPKDVQPGDFVGWRDSRGHKHHNKVRRIDGKTLSVVKWRRRSTLRVFMSSVEECWRARTKLGR